MKVRWTPARVGLAAASLAALLVLVGVARGNVPPEPRALVVALLIGSGSWGVVAWLFARVAWDVESESSSDEGGTPS